MGGNINGRYDHFFPTKYSKNDLRKELPCLPSPELQFGSPRNLNLLHGNRELRKPENIAKTDLDAFNKGALQEQMVNSIQYLVSEYSFCNWQSVTTSFCHVDEGENFITSCQPHEDVGFFLIDSISENKNAQGAFDIMKEPVEGSNQEFFIILYVPNLQVPIFTWKVWDGCSQNMYLRGKGLKE